MAVVGPRSARDEVPLVRDGDEDGDRVLRAQPGDHAELVAHQRAAQLQARPRLCFLVRAVGPRKLRGTSHTENMHTGKCVSCPVAAVSEPQESVCIPLTCTADTGALRCARLSMCMVIIQHLSSCHGASVLLLTLQALADVHVAVKPVKVFVRII